MANVANISQQRTPIPPEIFECDGISAATATQLKDTIIRIVNTDSQTRIGMFNLLQQDEIIAVIPKLLGRDDSVFLLTVISRFIIQLLQPSISATLGMIELRNKCKKALEKFQLVRAAEEKKTRKHEPGNPFALLFHEEPEYVKPDPILSYDISYGSPQVTTQIVARTPEEALAAVCLLTQIPSGQIDIYHISTDSSDTYVPARIMSSKQMNLIVPTTSLFSPLQSFSEPLGGALRPFNRYRTIHNSALWDIGDYKFMDFVVRTERLIQTGRLALFRDFLRRCYKHATEADNEIILRNIYEVQISILHSTNLSSAVLHAFLAWSPVVKNLRQVVKYAISSGIPSGFTRNQMSHLDQVLSSENHLLQTITQHGREIVIYQHTDSPNLKPTKMRECKKQKSIPKKKPIHKSHKDHRMRPTMMRKCKKQKPILNNKPVRNTLKDCRSFHFGNPYTSKISTFPTIAPPPHQSLPDALAHFQHNAENLSRQYETVIRQEVDERDQDKCERIISDAESLLTDEARLLSLSVSHRKYLREKLRRAIIQVRSILQEATAYDSSQLLNSTNNAKTLLHYFDRCQSNVPDLSRLSLDNKEKPD